MHVHNDIYAWHPNNQTPQCRSLSNNMYNIAHFDYMRGIALLSI